MDRRRFIATAGLVSVASTAGCLNDSGNENNPTSSLSPSPTEDFEGWVNEDEIEDGYTVVYISSDWEVVDAEQTSDWKEDEIQKGRRGFCKRYFVYENIPEGYNIFYQGSCSEGVTVSVEDDDGRVIKQFTLQEKEVDR